ncbi:MAG: ABC transporter permease, partial [Xenophilus sp.]
MPWRLLATFSWQELRHHPWRSAAAAGAVMLGVALAFAVHLINASALDAFQGAVRSVNGQGDLQIRAAQGDFDEALYGQVAALPQVALASPVLEAGVVLRTPAGARLALRLAGVDALVAPDIAPALAPVAADGDRLAVLSPGRIFLNPAARRAADGAAALTVLRPDGTPAGELHVAGTVAAGGEALGVMDIGAAQDLLGRAGRLSRIDLRLRPGAGG